MHYDSASPELEQILSTTTRYTRDAGTDTAGLSHTTRCEMPCSVWLLASCRTPLNTKDRTNNQRSQIIDNMRHASRSLNH